MISLSKQLGTGGVYSQYDGEDHGSITGSDGVVKPLDRPDPELVGGCKLDRMKKAASGWEWATIVFIILITCRGARSEFAAPIQKRSEKRVTADKYLPHIKELVEVGILKKTNLALFVCTYFAVLKNEEKCRTIFNGKRLSKQMPPPPPVNLLDLSEFVKISLRWKGRLCTVLSDIRHWFHQIPVCDFLKTLFVIRILFFDEDPQAAALTDFAWQVLPMGWAWSPFICQVLAWILILHVPPGGKDFFKADIRSWKGLPKYVWSADGKCFVSLLYDNIIFYSADPKVADQFAERLRQNYSFFNIKPKFLDVILPDSILIGPDDKVPISTVYRGVEIGQRQVKVGVHKTCARVDPEKVKKWKSIQVPTANAPVTPLEVARVVGIIIYVATVRQLALCEKRKAVDILSRVGKHVKGDRNNWKMPDFSLTKEEQDILSDEWSWVHVNPWVEEKLDTTERRRMWFATDASDEGYGMVPLLEDPSVRTHQNTWDEEGRMRNAPIFLRELLAAVVYIMHLAELGYNDLTIVVDNTAAAGALRRMYSTNGVACDRLEKLFQFLKDRDVVLEVITCASKDNVADNPSHLKPVDPTLRKKCIDIIKAEKGGTRITNQCRTKVWKYTDDTCARHADVTGEEKSEDVELFERYFREDCCVGDIEKDVFEMAEDQMKPFPVFE